MTMPRTVDEILQHPDELAARIASYQPDPADALASGPTGYSADTQPPLRPLAPNPTWAASNTTTLSEGSARRR